MSIARLKPGVSVADARSEMDLIGRSLATAHQNDNAGQTVRVVPMNEYGSRGLRAPLYTMLGVVGFVLLIACVNVANLMLARAATARPRARDSTRARRGTRPARPATADRELLAGLRRRYVRTVARVVGTRASVAILPNYLKLVPLHRGNELGVDAAVLVFTSIVSIASGLLFGLAPALASFRRDERHPLTENARGSTGGKSRLRYGLVASEVALTLVVPPARA